MWVKVGACPTYAYTQVGLPHPRHVVVGATVERARRLGLAIAAHPARLIGRHVTVQACWVVPTPHGLSYGG